MKEFEDELYSEDFINPYIFRGFSAHFHGENPLIDNAKIVFKFRAGRVSSTVNGQKYIFIDKSEFDKKNHEELKKHKLIDLDFILNSNKAGKLLDIENYVI